MRGSALDTTVLESIATNMARRRPDRASSTSRWVIAPACSAAAGAAVVGTAWDTMAFRVERSGARAGRRTAGLTES